jgi:site-specific DNA-methyltransferase (adenine-specific)
MPQQISQNTLFYGDNLPILRDHIPTGSIDLIYLDPPFNSSRSYNVLFADESGKESEAQITAFEDTWHWDQSAAHTYHDLIQNGPLDVVKMIGSLHDFIGENQMMAYLVMMAVRLVELHRVLKPTGSLYLHCDPTASHYLKIVLDTVFGVQNFRNEIIWRRTGSHNSAKRCGPIHDVVFFYTKSDNYVWNKLFRPYTKGYVESFFNKEDSRGRYRSQALTGSGTRNGESGTEWNGYNPTTKGRHWAFPGILNEEFGLEAISLHEKLDFLLENELISSEVGGLPEYRQYLHQSQGTPLQDIWTYQPYTEGLLINTKDGIDSDVRWFRRGERMGYPTEKPIGLLERIIQASSNPGDWVLDPFCGCGTAIAAAQKLERHWIGIDITHLAIALQKYRLQDTFNITAGKNYQVIGEPCDEAAAVQLAKDNRYQFQWWALSLVGAKPLGGEQDSKTGKKGKDRGIDGVINFVEAKGKPKRVLVQVKSGKVNSGLIRDLRGTVEREDAAIGVFITLEPATKDMEKEAIAAGYYTSELWQKDYQRIQIMTIAQLLSGAEIQMPAAHGTFKQAQRVRKAEGAQPQLEI